MLMPTKVKKQFHMPVKMVSIVSHLHPSYRDMHKLTVCNDKVHVPKFDQICVCMAPQQTYCHETRTSMHCQNMNNGMSCISKQASSHTCHLQKQAPVLPSEKSEAGCWQWCRAI